MHARTLSCLCTVDTAVADTWKSIKEHQDGKWHTNNVFSMKPPPIVVPVVVEEKPAPTEDGQVVQWVKRSSKESAENVYHRYYPMDSLQESSWTGTDDESVRRIYYRMNIHYYIGKGHTVPYKHHPHTHSVITCSPTSSHHATTSQLCLFADKAIYDLLLGTGHACLPQCTFS